MSGMPAANQTQSLLAHRMGAHAERRARWRLRLQGWRIVATNWRTVGGELDIVASRWKTLLVAEVRYRSAGDGIASVDQSKLARTVRAAKHLVQLHHLHQYRLRFDVLALDSNGSWRHHKDVLRQSASRTT